MLLAAIQYRPPKGEVERARCELRTLCLEALEGGARVVVAPEMATTGYIWRDPDALRPFAEVADGPTLRCLGPLAARYGAWIVAGIAEAAPDGALYNSALVINPKGALAACYRKVLLYEADLPWARAGNRHMLLDTEFGTLMPGICMDINDDRFADNVRRARPDVLAFCTNWVDEGRDDIAQYWQLRLAGWDGWLVAADSWGQDEETRFYGRSAILGPQGVVHAMAPCTGNQVIFADAGGLSWG